MAAVLAVAAVIKAKESNYFRSLDPAVAKRYRDKITLLDGNDPYCLSPDEWSINISNLPGISYPDIVNYFVFKRSYYSMDDFKAYKSLEAYNQFAFGWVRDVKWKRFEDHTLISGKVLHSMKVNEKPLEPWAILEEEGTIISAHCTCMAGLGEACTHVAALMFYVEFAVRHRKTKTVTQEAAYWTPPPTKEVPYSRMCQIDFSTPKRKCAELEEQEAGLVQDSTHVKKKTGKCPEQSMGDFMTFLANVKDTGYESAILSIVDPFCEDFIPKSKSKLNVLHLDSFYNEDNCKLSHEELIGLGKALDLSITSSQAEEVEKKSRLQAESKNWFRFRAGRITASKFKAACKTRSATSSPSLVKSICYPEKCKFKSKATEWGCHHEKTARKSYEGKLGPFHKNFKTQDVGLILNPQFPHFGATPDAFVTCDCCGKGCLEIKCPYCIKDTSIEANISKVSCLKLVENGSMNLKMDHSYFYQIQAQLFISNLSYCDFVVWTSQGEPHIERIKPNKEFWDSESPKATQFFHEAIIPELLGKFFSLNSEQNDPNIQDEGLAEETWCSCKQDVGGKMIMCEKEGCKILWYHTACVGIKRIPKGKWVCKNCKS